MSAKTYAPLHVWVERYPLAESIAARLSPDLLGLRTRRLCPDLMQTLGIGRKTAMRAIGMARRASHHPARGYGANPPPSRDLGEIA